MQKLIKQLNLERQVLALPALSHQKGAGTVDVVAMQERDVHDAIRARSSELDWLFHVDDDELLHLTSGKVGRGELAKVVEWARVDVQFEIGQFGGATDFPEIKAPYNFFEEETHFKLRVALHADGSSVKKHHDARFYVHGGNPGLGRVTDHGPLFKLLERQEWRAPQRARFETCGVHFFGSARGDARAIQRRRRRRFSAAPLPVLPLLIRGATSSMCWIVPNGRTGVIIGRLD